MKRKCFLAASLILAFLFLVAASCPQTMKDWSPKQKAIYANGLYVKQWDAYVNKIAFAANVDPVTYMTMVMSDDPGMQAQAREIAKNANLTEEQRKVLRAQKKALLGMEKALDLYEAAIEGGSVPSEALEKELLSLSNQLENWLLTQNW